MRGGATLSFANAVADIAARPVGAEKRAAAWAQQIAMTSDGVPLRSLLRIDGNPHVDVSAYCQTTRAHNILRSCELQDAAELLDLTVSDLLDLRKCGLRTVLDILQALLIAVGNSSRHGSHPTVPATDQMQDDHDPVDDRHTGQQRREDHVHVAPGSNWADGHVIADIAEKLPVLRPAAARAWAIQIAATRDGAPLRKLLGVPGAPHIDVTTYCRDMRAYNVLRSSWLTDLDDLLAYSIADLRALKQCDTKTVTDILQAMLVALSQERGAATLQAPTPTPRRLDAVAYATGQKTARPEPTPTAHDIPALIHQWSSKLDHREALIARHRLKRDRTLDDLGNDLGITRERVRQIEVKVWGKLANWRVSAAPAAALLDLNHEIQNVVIVVASERRILDKLPELAATIPALGCQVVDLISALVPGIARESGWVALKPLADLRDQTVKVAFAAEDSQAHGDTVSRLEATRRRLGLTEAEWAQWLGYCRLRSIGRVAVRSEAGIPELAAALLRESESPMSDEEIAVKLGTDSVRYVKNRLLEDPRIVRLGPNLFGLPEWGLESYEGIKEEIIQRIERGGGRVEIQKLVDELASQFGVSPKSVQSYAAGREFVRKAGRLYLAQDQPTVTGLSSHHNDNPAATRRCYFRDGRWWFRVDVGRDALRGSGFAVPTGIMRLFQIAEGTERTFSAEGTRVRISWVRPQPTFGSVRPLLLALQAAPGDALWLTPTGGDWMDVRLARMQDAGALPAIAHLTGTEYAEDTELLRKSIAEAAGLPADKSWHALEQSLRGRGDIDIAELVEETFPAAPGATPTLDEFLSALRSRK
jgi:hypothetical protein